MNFKSIIMDNIKQLILVVAAFFLMVIVSYLFTRSIVGKRIEISSIEMLHSAETNLSAQIQEAEMLLNNGAFFIQESLDSDQSHEQINSLLHKVTQWYKSLPNSPAEFIGIYGYFKGKLLLGIEWEPPEGFKIEERPWYRDALDLGGAVTFSAPYVDARTNTITISLSKALYDPSGKLHGVICVDVDMGPLSEKVRAIRFAEGGYGMLIGTDFTFLTYPDDYYIGKYMGDISPAYSRLVQEMKTGVDIPAVRLRNHEGVQVVLLVKQIANGWYMGMATPIRAYYRDVYIMALVLSFLGLAFACLLCYILLRLSMAKLQSDEGNKSKSSFLARMSHEIRTPLNAILGLSEVELQNNLPERTRINMEKIYASGSHLLEIVNDVLDISKVESGNFEILPVRYEFYQLISDTVQLNLPRIGSKPIRFSLDLAHTIPSTFFGDELRIRQILTNLLTNAFKYTEKGEVHLRVSWDRREDAALLYFAVEDTGRGIRREDMEKLFSEYTQLDVAASQRIGGTGLGLSITRGLVTMMGGTITAESEYGKGSVFRFVLPQKIIDETPIGAERVQELGMFRFQENHSRIQGNNIIRSYMPYGKVLVVDDVITNLDVITGLLAPYGLKVDTVSSGVDAVERIREGEPRYDLVFMDHMMPGMDGVEAVRIIRNEIGGDYARNVPIVVLTANAITGIREKFLESGFTDFISKPIDIKMLDMVLNQWIRDRQNREEQAVEWEQPGGDDDETRWFQEHQEYQEYIVEGVDLNEAIELYGDMAVCISIFKSFVINTPSLLEKMSGYLDTSLPDYTIAVHGLKGACGAIYAKELAAAAKVLEIASKEGRLEYVRSQNGELERQTRVVIERLRVLVEEWEGGQAEEEREMRAEPDRQALDRLRAAAAESNTNRVEEILDELEAYRYEKGEDLIRWLRAQAGNFEYEAIYRRLGGREE